MFLALSAQYESWSLPLAILLIVPMCLFSAAFGVWLHGREINILTQIGFVVLIALAAKNSILIVEFARQLEEQGKDTISAAVEACRLRLRPIIMTSLAFTLGVVPLYLAVGAGAEMRIALGTAVFWGMIGVTLFGLIFTPVFYVVDPPAGGRQEGGGRYSAAAKWCPRRLSRRNRLLHPAARRPQRWVVAPVSSASAPGPRLSSQLCGQRDVSRPSSRARAFQTQARPPWALCPRHFRPSRSASPSSATNSEERAKLRQMGAAVFSGGVNA